MSTANIWQPTTIISPNADTKALIQNFTATSSQADFTITGYTYILDTQSLVIYRNGLRLVRDTDWAEVSTTEFSITSPNANAGDIISAVGVVGIIPVLPDELARFEAILADTVAAKNAAVVAKNEAVAAAASSTTTVDTFANLILLSPTNTGGEYASQDRIGIIYILQPANYTAAAADAVFSNSRVGAANFISSIADLSHSYIFQTVAELKSSLLVFAVGKSLETTNYHAGIIGGSAKYTVKTAAQASSDGDTIDGFGNHSISGGMVAILSVEIYTPLLFGAKEGQVASDNLEAFNLLVTQQNKIRVSYLGNYFIDRQLVIGHPTNKRPDFESANFDLRIKTSYTSSDDAVVFDGMGGTVCTGRLEVDCGSSTYASRRQRDCVRLKKAERIILPAIQAFGAKRNGFFADSAAPNKTSLSSVPFMKIRFSGGELTQSAQSFTNQGSANSIQQYTDIVLDAIPEFLEELDYLDFDGNPYIIQAIDLATKTIQVHPWVISPVIGNVTLLVGSGVKFTGGDTSLWNIGTLDLMNNTVMYKPHALYPPTVDILHSNFSKIVVAVGRRNNAVQGGGINLLYVEGGNSTTYSAVVSSGAMDSFYINTSATAYLQNTRVLAPNNGNVYTQRENKIVSLSVGDDNAPLFSANSKPNNGQRISSNLAPKFTSTTCLPNSLTKDTLTVNLKYSEDHNRNVGCEAQMFLATGTGSNGQATGTWTFNPPAGWTVNGSTSVTATGMSRPTLFFTHYDIATLNIRLSKLEMVGL